MDRQSVKRTTPILRRLGFASLNLPEEVMMDVYRTVRGQHNPALPLVEPEVLPEPYVAVLGHLPVDS